MRFSLLGLLALLFALNSCSSDPKAKAGAEEFLLRMNDDALVYVKKRGSGPPCIFVHGGPGAWSKSFEEMGGSELEKHFTMIYYDQRGCGRSESAKDYRLKRMIQDLEEIRIHLHLDKVFLMGHSFGGIIATNYASVYSENVEGLILANATLNLKKSLKSQIKFSNELTGEKVDSKHKSILLNSFAQAKNNLQSKGLEYKTLTDNKASFELLESIDTASPSEYDFAQKVWDFPEYLKNYVFLSKKVDIPTLIIAGTEDHAVGPDHHKAFLFPNKEVKEIKGSHLLYYENNSEFVEAVNFFAKGLKGDG